MGNWDRKSTSGWAICFNNTAAIFSSKLQSTTALSTAEAEVNSACEVSKSIVHMQLLLQELGFTEHLDKPCLVMEDNSSCVAFAHNLKSRKTTRHFELRVHYLQELVVMGSGSAVSAGIRAGARAFEAMGMAEGVLRFH